MMEQFLMHWIDGHLDLAYLAMRGRDLTVPNAHLAHGCISLPELRDAEVTLAFATLYIDIGSPDAPYGYASHDDIDGAERAAMRQLEYYEALEAGGHLRIVRSLHDLENDSAPLRIVILMEGADPIRSPKAVEQWFARGVRMVGLTWAKGSRYAGGNAAPGPLTRAGVDLIDALDAVGMIHDLSHLADDAAAQLLDRARGPVMASHSNARAVMGNDNQRHLTDDLIREIAARDGVVGLNLYTRFLAVNHRATVDDCIAHLEHITSVMGHRNGTGLGSDADGGFPPTDMPLDLDHPTKWRNLTNALTARGWSADDIDGFTCGNWIRFLHRALPAS